jgi:hypothetical protein
MAADSRIAVILYLYYTDMWSFYRDHLSKFTNIKLFLILSTNNINTHIISDCKKNFKEYNISTVSNKGLDLLPFLNELQNIDDKKFPFFVKLHTKKSIIFDNDDKEIWNSVLTHSVIGNQDILQKNIDIMTDDSVAACCLDTFTLNNNERQHTFKIQELCNIFKIRYTECKNTQMMTGGVFIGKTHVYKDFFNTKKIKTINSIIEYGSVNRDKPTYTHSLECILSYFLTDKKYKIENTYVESIKIFNKETNKTLHLIQTFNNFCYIHEKPNINGKVINYNKDYLDITWNNIHDKRIQKYIKISDGIFQRVSDKQNIKTFDVTQYKALNNDLINLSDDEAESHYFTHGKNENRIHKLETISRVFDSEFYAKKYDIDASKALAEYVKKGRFENRSYNQIIDDGFDYGEYICCKNINNNIPCTLNQYDALYEYRKHNIKKRINRVESIKDNTITLDETTCIYVASIHCKRDIILTVQDLKKISKHCVDITLFTNNKYAIKELQSNFSSMTCVHKNIKDYTWLYQCYIDGLTNTKIKNNILLLSNKTIIINDIKNVLISSQESNADFVFLTSEYCKHIYDHSINLKVHQNFIFFKRKNIKMLINFFKNILKTQATYTLYELVQFELVQFLFKMKKSIKAFIRPYDYKELIWNNICDFNVCNEPDIIYKERLPIVDKQNLYYLNSTVPHFFKKTSKNTTRLTQWLDSDILSKYKIKKNICAVINLFTLSNINEFAGYIKTLFKKCSKLTVIITGNKDAFKLLKKQLTHKITFIETFNKGMDIGPFMHVLRDFYNNNKHYDYIIKLQEKRTVHWRKYMINNIIDNLEHYCALMEKETVSLCAPYRFLLNLDNLNKTTINYIIQRYNIPFIYDYEETYNGFIGGTMFLAKHKLFNDFFDTYHINLDYEIDILEEGAVVNDFATYTHAWERMLTCIIPTVMKTELRCI